MPRRAALAFSLVALGITLLLASFAARWAQDASAPWLNLGEARMRGVVRFDADAGRYRVITSGSTRPRLNRTGCDVALADGTRIRRLGGEGTVDARQALGVSRVIEFDAPSGPTSVVCGDRISRRSTLGRFQVVAADGPLSKAILAGLVVGLASALAGGLLLWRSRGRSDDDAPLPPELFGRGTGSAG